jgi:hypothetical protein
LDHDVVGEPQDGETFTGDLAEYAGVGGVGWDEGRGVGYE